MNRNSRPTELVAALIGERLSFLPTVLDDIAWASTDG